MDLPSTHPPTASLSRQMLRASLRHVLAEMGTTGSEVAQTLRAAGVKGTKKSGRDCAVALYLRALVTGDRRVRSIAVWGNCIHVQRSGTFRPPIRLAVPDPVRTFIVDFDRGDFPELVRGESVNSPDGAHGGFDQQGV
jgi:hypothetical protein